MAAANGFILNVYELDMTPVGERLVEPPIRIGRSSLNDVCVAHRLVSEFHARIEQVEDKLCVRDLNSKNGVLVETVGSSGAARIVAMFPIDLEPYGYEFLLSPLLRVRVRPAGERELASHRHSHAVGSVLGNSRFMVGAASALAEDQLTEGFAPGSPAGVVPGHRPGAVHDGFSGAVHDGLSDAVPGAGTSAQRPTPFVPPAAPRVISSRLPAAGSARPVAPVSVAAPPTLPPLPGAQLASHAAVLGQAAASFPPRPEAGASAQHHHSAASRAPSPAVQPYASVLIEPPSGPLPLPPSPGHGVALELPPLADRAPAQTQLSHPAARHTPAPRASSAPRHAPARNPAPQRPSAPQHPPAGRNSTWIEHPEHLEPLVPALAHTAWEPHAHGTLPAAGWESSRPSEAPGRSLEALALHGLRELAASLLPGQPVESAADVVQLITKLHDAVEMFCRCFIPVREACSRFIATDDLERAAMERCHNRSASYLAIERALEPRAVAAALLNWRNDDQDAPRAVEHILADLMLHHLGFSQSALEGTQGLLEELSPANIAARQVRTPSMLDRLGLSGGPERELWATFSERHKELQSIGRAFRELFGEQFSRAYAAHWPSPGSGSPP